jgi:hypothetical protein
VNITQGQSAADSLHAVQLKAAGCQVVAIPPDNDKKGIKHGQDVWIICHQVGLQVKVVTLPGLPDKGDVVDWFAAGHTAEELDALIDQTPWDVPPPSSEPPKKPTIEDLPTFLTRLSHLGDLEWYVPGLIPDEGICLRHGQPRDFKSFFALAVALDLAAGRTALGHPRFTVHETVPVAFFVEEDSERLVYWRLRRLINGTETGPVPPTFYPFIRRNLNFDEKECQDAILSFIKECGAKVVFFDPLRSLTAHADQGPAALRPVTLFLRQIQHETLAKTLILLHHDKKPTTLPIENPEHTRSQQASGGGIFSISDCPVAFHKLTWNTVGVYPRLQADRRPGAVHSHLRNP